MKKLLLEMLRIGSTIATTLTANALGADKEIAIALGTTVGTAISGIVDLNQKPNSF